MAGHRKNEKVDEKVDLNEEELEQKCVYIIKTSYYIILGKTSIEL